jgi:hypothetical protein
VKHPAYRKVSIVDALEEENFDIAKCIQEIKNDQLYEIVIKLLENSGTVWYYKRRNTRTAKTVAYHYTTKRHNFRKRQRNRRTPQNEGLK